MNSGGHFFFFWCFFFQAEDGIRYLVRSRGLGDVYKRQLLIYWSGVRVPPGVQIRKFNSYCVKIPSLDEGFLLLNAFISCIGFARLKNIRFLFFRRKTNLKISLYTFILFAIILISVQAQDIEDTLMIYGRDRFYKTHLPLGYNSSKSYPLVLAFHGGLGNPDLLEEQSGFSAKADKEGFIVVYPYGTGSFDKKLLTWNTWNCCGYADKKNINDVDFIKAVLKEIKAKYSIDEKRVYATGLSNGGMMCYLLACELPEQFAAVAPVAGAMFDTLNCDPKSEVSFIIFNSVDDLHVPYNGGAGEAVSYTHLRAHETGLKLVCRLLLEKKKKKDTHT